MASIIFYLEKSLKNTPSPPQKPAKKKTFFQACHKTAISVALFDILIGQITLFWLPLQEVLRRFVMAMIILAFLLVTTYKLGLYEDRILFGPDEDEDA